MFAKSLTQTVGKPVDTDRTRSLQGDEFHVTGRIEVTGTAGSGFVHYTFKGPALVGQAQSPPEGVLPPTAGTVDVAFPCRFTEKPTFTQGYEHGENQSQADGLIPMVASVVSWNVGRRQETGLPYYDGARVLITAASAAPAAGGDLPAAGGLAGTSVLRNSNFPVYDFAFVEWTALESQKGTATSWDAGTPDVITINESGFYWCHGFFRWEGGVSTRTWEIILLTGTSDVFGRAVFVGPTPTDGQWMQASGGRLLAAGDTVKLQAAHTVSATVNLTNYKSFLVTQLWAS